MANDVFPGSSSQTPGWRPWFQLASGRHAGRGTRRETGRPRFAMALARMLLCRPTSRSGRAGCGVEESPAMGASTKRFDSARIVCALVWLLPLGLGCAGADPDEGALEATSVHENALDDGGLGDDPGLCDRLTAKRAALGKATKIFGHQYNVIQGTDKDDELIGTSGPDVIFGGKGADKIHGRGGTDIICAGAGPDFVDGGLGQDRIYGEDGNDILHGGNAGDWIHGGPDEDYVYGDLLDDKLFGDEGSDVLIGSHGVDYMDGGAGDDWLRGDTNGDELIGGPGDDVASFMTARPTGRSGKNATTVMDIDMKNQRADGDGAAEPLKSIEKVIGSPFADSFSGDPDKFAAGVGADTCNGTPCGNAPPALPFVFVDARPRDTGVVVLGSKDNDRMIFSRENGNVVVTEISGGTLHPGAHCTAISVSAVKCTPPAPLRYLMAYGDDGDDELTIQKGFPRDFNAHIDGGPGDDDLFGADGDDVLFTGRSGVDRLDGGPGDDALISESYGDDRQTTGQNYPGGADVLLGRSGNDQLVTDYPCGRHYYSGGPGIDIAGFARVGSRKIHAQLRGKITLEHKSKFFGKAFLPGFCDVEHYGTDLEEDLEILEGSKGADTLLGNEEDNIIWGRQGNDTLAGFGGVDVLLGHEGKDSVAGGTGEDVEHE